MIPHTSLVLNSPNLYFNLKRNITGIKRGNNIPLKINFIYDSVLSLAFPHPFIRSVVKSRTSRYPNRTGYCFLMHPVWSREPWEPSETDGYKLSTWECPVFRVGLGERKISSFLLGKKTRSNSLHTKGLIVLNFLSYMFSISIKCNLPRAYLDLMRTKYFPHAQ